jgi:hypothetical protein
MGVKLNEFLIPSLDGGELSAPRYGCVILSNRAPDKPRIGRTGLRIGLNVVEKRNILATAGDRTLFV